MKGFLWKLGHRVKNWKRRYFVLENGVLKYYVNPSDRHPYGSRLKGIIYLYQYEMFFSEEGSNNLKIKLQQKNEWAKDSPISSILTSIGLPPLPRPSLLPNVLPHANRLKDYHIEGRGESDLDKWKSMLVQHMEYTSRETFS
jgi:hypothetical protein